MPFSRSFKVLWISTIKRRFLESQFEIQRIFDLLLVIALMPLWLPLCVVLALVVWLGDINAPIFHRQKRVGLHGNEFLILKFRTMVKNAEAMKADLAHFNERVWPDFKMSNDPRITWAGRFLRKTSLDELPQLINVLKGEMSLVGPRPTSFALETYDIWHTERLEVRPGLTGYWQVTSRESNFDDRVRLDVKHVRAFTLRSIIILLFYTIPAALKGQ